jgi:hypothetical protein
MPRMHLSSSFTRLVSVTTSGLVAWLLVTLAGASLADAGVLQVEAAPADVQASFEHFAAEWMDGSRRLSLVEPPAPAKPASEVLGAGGDLGSEPGWSTEVRITRDATIPYLGLLRYVEERRTCTESRQSTCARTFTAVTEIFRFEAGHWVY